VPFRVCHPFSARRTQLLDVLEHAGWRLKRYAIVHGDGAFDAPRFAPGRALALAALPSPAVAAERPGVGLLIEHQGNGVDYEVLAWWDRENELPLRVFVREEELWRPARGAESICVWDLEVLGAERDAYVASVLGPGGPDLAAYLAASAPEGARP
jgi:hypothetical protein